MKRTKKKTIKQKNKKNKLLQNKQGQQQLVMHPPYITGGDAIGQLL